MQGSSKTNLLILVITLVVCVGLLELALRYVLPEDMNTTWDLRIPHPVFGWALKPDVRYSYRMLNRMVAVEYNSLGYRDTAHTFDNPAGTPRVVVLGDSFMEGFSVEHDEAFHKRLASHLAAGGVPAEVINLGVGGYGTLQEYLVYRDIGSRYRPQTVLLGFYFGNDLRNNSRELEVIVNAGSKKVESRPFLQQVTDGELVFTPVDYAGAEKRYHEALASKDTLFRRLAGHSAVLRAAELVMERLLPDTEEITEDYARQRDYVNLGMHHCEETAQFTRAWENTRLLLEQLQRAVQADGVRLVIFTVSAWHEVEPEYMARTIAGYHDAAKLCLDEAPAYRRLADIADGLGIEMVNLLPEFRRRAEAGERFFLADRHWNAAGHELAASAVARVLLQ